MKAISSPSSNYINTLSPLLLGVMYITLEFGENKPKKLQTKKNTEDLNY